MRTLAREENVEIALSEIVLDIPNPFPYKIVSFWLRRSCRSGVKFSAVPDPKTLPKGNEVHFGR
jgi:hypothetical protein